MLFAFIKIVIYCCIVFFPFFSDAASNPYDGTWEGITSEGDRVTMVVQNNKMISFSAENTLRVNPGVPINNNKFSYESEYILVPGGNRRRKVEGRFSGLTSCTGTLFYSEASPQTCTWSITGGPYTLAKPQRVDYTDKISIISSLDINAPPYNLVFGQNSFWAASDYLNTINRYDLSGNLIASFDSPSSLFGGEDLAFDGNDLWLVDQSERRLYRISTQGTVRSSFSIQMQHASAYPSGLTFDGNNLWLYAHYYNGYLFKIDLSGHEVSRFPVPDGIGHNGTRLAYDGKYLWLYDQNQIEKLYKFDLNGNLLESYDSVFSHVAGITFYDNYLWIASQTRLADYNNNNLIKALLPQSVSIGESISQIIQIQNAGNLPLRINSLKITGQNMDSFQVADENCTQQFIFLNNGCKAEILFSPSSTGRKTALLEVHSNDSHRPIYQISLMGKADSVCIAPMLEILL